LVSQKAFNKENCQEDAILSARTETQNNPLGKCTSNQALLAKIEDTLASQFPIEKILYTDKKQVSSEIILKYVDFSSKYGMGYKLNNGSYGVLFNDSTKIVLDANCFHFDYVHRQPQ